jgi:hypothetical protein
VVTIGGAYISLQIKETKGRLDEKVDDVETGGDLLDEDDDELLYEPDDRLPENSRR